ncbi:Pyruvate decarboxylase 1 [Talaromyces marneffei ATCC 18224]
MADISIGQYIFTRLSQLGVKSVFGVPGDYELIILDMTPAAGLTWRGNANELIASYAADGYARVNGIGAFVTTFGPGELSAYCGMAGQYAEYVPVVHIVGYPSTSAMKSGAVMHHSLGDGEFGMYQKMIKHITVADIILDDVGSAASEIDRVLETMLYHSRPVHLSKPLITSLPSNMVEEETKIITEIVNLLQFRKDPVIVVDGGAIRFDLLHETREIITSLQVPYFSTAMSKGSISECLGDGKLFGGVYSGGASPDSIRAAVEKSELALFIGRYPACLGLGEFTTQLQDLNIVDFQRFSVNIAGKSYNLANKYLLQKLVQHISSISTLGRYFRANDFIIAETGTSSYGIPAANLMHLENVRMYNQTVFGSIGYATGAALGSFVAGKEDGSVKRGILVTGEGSLQLTVQALADYLRWGLNATIFIVNNGGYTVERLIHGMDALYNTIPVWKYEKLSEVFGPDHPSRYDRIETGAELVELLNYGRFSAADCTQVVELILGKDDAPLAVKMASAAVEAFNLRQ